MTGGRDQGSSHWKLFRYATAQDIVLLFLDTVFAILHGAGWPLLAIVFGHMTNAFIHQQQARFYDGDSTNFTMLPPLQTFGEAIRRSGVQSMFDPVTMLEYITMNKFALTYVIIAAGVFVSSFIHVHDCSRSGCKYIAAARRKYIAMAFGFGLTFVVLYGAYSLAFCELEDNSSAKEQYILPSDGQQTSSDESTDKESSDEDLSENGSCGDHPMIMVGSFSLGNALPQLNSIAVAQMVAGCVFEVIDGRPDIDSYSELGVQLKQLTSNLSFKDISFFYPRYSGHLVFFAVMVGSFSLGNALPQLNSIAVAQMVAGCVFEVIDGRPDIDSYSELGVQLKQLTSNLSFKDISFFYPRYSGHLITCSLPPEYIYPSRPSAAFNGLRNTTAMVTATYLQRLFVLQVLRDVSLEAGEGQVVAICGTSGSGKSTQLNLVVHFYDPCYGEITLDGVNLRSLSVRWLHSEVSLVSERTTLFNYSIAENIQLAKRKPQ
ncbi:hypothetical protein HPB49_010862 [Dermacentor silvarum]|uniref:Uncharacterized protein n=1 Tax=Dermacentor silvarum TaxID=543639 RepID=A0ACB8DYZ9_DERSI|nr:hypothetical protein HPB49_010862 [Dermacentor silvarum]